MSTPTYEIRRQGESRSFPEAHALTDGAGESGDVLIHLGRDIRHEDDAARTAILIELGTECLGVHTGESRGDEGSNVLGFARFRMGDDAPSDLIELVRQPNTDEAALTAARAVFEGAGLTVAVCEDFAGRMIDRMLRPYFNGALNRLDEKLASADDLDLTLKLGLGYPEGPIALLERSGLHHHHDITQAIFEVTGKAAYAPARRARVAAQRRDRRDGQG